MARLRSRIDAVRRMLDSYKIAVLRESWTGNRLDFAVRALGQTAEGAVDVFDDHVRIEVRLPWLLAAFAERASGLLRSRSALLLGHEGGERKPGA